MAYFSNGTEGMIFEEECSTCKYGQTFCPIYSLQLEHNYSACNNKEARQILEGLVSDKGKCSMKQTFKKDFYINPNQTKLF